MGRVYEAEHLLRRPPRGYQLPAGRDVDPGAVAPMLREARTAARIEHSHLEHILDVAKDRSTADPLSSRSY